MIREGKMISIYHLVTHRFFKKSVVNRGIKLYNRLPLAIKRSEGFKDFKNKLKLFLLEHPFYILNELFAGDF
jgi:hypothetical protein